MKLATDFRLQVLPVGVRGVEWQARQAPKCFNGGIRRIAQKVEEEGVEIALAAVVQGDEDLLGATDLVFHLIVALRARGCR